MDGGRDPADSHRLPRLAEKFHDKQYRDGYVASHTRGVLAQQIRNFRGDLSQAEYAEKLGKQKTVIGRLENPGYAGWSLRTMLEIARKEDVAVLVRFVDFPTFLGFTDDTSDKSLHPNAYNAVETDGFSLFSSQANVDPVSAIYFGVNYALHNVVVAPGMGMTMGGGPSTYNNAFFGSNHFSGLNVQAPTFTGVHTLSDVSRSPFFLAADSNTGMHELMRRKNREIFDLKNELSALRAEIIQLRSTSLPNPTPDILSRPQSQGNVIPFPAAA